MAMTSLFAWLCFQALPPAEEGDSFLFFFPKSFLNVLNLDFFFPVWKECCECLPSLCETCRKGEKARLLSMHPILCSSAARSPHSRTWGTWHPVSGHQQTELGFCLFWAFNTRAKHWSVITASRHEQLSSHLKSSFNLCHIQDQKQNVLMRKRPCQNPNFFFPK